MRIGILFFAIICCNIAYSQSYIVTPDGLRDTSDNTKRYLVFNIEGKTSQQLYDNAMNYLIKKYSDFNDKIIGKIEGEYLKFDAHYYAFVIDKNVSFDADYTVELNFKDGKVKYEITSLLMHVPDYYIPLTFTGQGMLNWYIYNENGELKKPDDKSQIENNFRREIDELINALKNTEIQNW